LISGGVERHRLFDDYYILLNIINFFILQRVMLFASIDPSQPRPEAKPVNVDLTVAATPASQTADHFGQTVDRHWRIPERQKQSKQSPATA